MGSKIKLYWDYIQSLLDVRGDTIMLAFTAAVIYKIIHTGMNPSDAAAYASAIAAFAYSNK